MTRAARLLALACGAVAAGNALADISVRDDMGRSLHARAPAVRIVSLSDSLTDLAMNAGLGSRLVAVSDQVEREARPMSATTVATGERLSVTQIAQLKPDVVLTTLDNIRPEDVDRLTAAGINVFVARNLRLEDPPRIVRALATLTGRDLVPIAEAYERKIQRLRDANARKAPLTVFIELWHRPLKSVSAVHFLTEASEACGARNIFGDWQTVATPVVTYDHIRVREPDVIVGISSASNGEEFRANWNLRPTLRAVRERRLLFVYAESPQKPGLKSPADIEQLCDGLDVIRSSMGTSK